MPAVVARSGGPQPRNSLAPKGADYQGILECPCTTKSKKILDGYATWQPSSAAQQQRCATGARVESKSECAHAAASVGLLPIVSGNVSGAGFGCQATLTPDGWRLSVGGQQPCGARGASPAREGVTALAAGVGVSVRVAMDGGANVTLTLEGNASAWFGVGFGAKSMQDLPCAGPIPSFAPLAAVGPIIAGGTATQGAMRE